MCTKVKFTSRVEAVLVARAMFRTGASANLLFIYPCAECRFWHHTSHPVGRKWLKLQRL